MKNSILTGNGKSGVHDEISSGPAVLSSNTIKGNGTLDVANRHAGMLIISSAHVDGFDNTFGGKVGPGVQIADDGSVVGCGLAGADCYRK